MVLSTEYSTEYHTATRIVCQLTFLSPPQKSSSFVVRRSSSVSFFGLRSRVWYLCSFVASSYLPSWLLFDVNGDSFVMVVVSWWCRGGGGVVGVAWWWCRAGVVLVSWLCDVFVRSMVSSFVRMVSLFVASYLLLLRLRLVCRGGGVVVAWWRRALTVPTYCCCVGVEWKSN